MHLTLPAAIAALCLLLLSACQPLAPATAVPSEIASGTVSTAPVTIETTTLPAEAPCQDTFIEHILPFATGTRLREIRMYESNGAGVAANDLDNDGDLDLVFASIDRESAILWNQGNLTFVRQEIDDPFTRGVNIVDVDGDGHLDITFTHRGLRTLSFWRNLGRAGDRTTPLQNEFVLRPLPDVVTYAYAMAWGDLNADGALDLVTGSYNIDLEQQGIDQPASVIEAGVVAYLATGDGYTPVPLSEQSQALSLALLDLNQDNHLDIWVANDFDLPDAVWLGNGAAQPWTATPAQPFNQISHSTMTIEWGDLANDGRTALLTTDMMPYDQSPETLAAWQPVMEGMMADMDADHAPDAPGEQHSDIESTEPTEQVMENVLQVQTPAGQWQNQAAARAVQATGWSWAAKFGDLDRDGYLDLYVVNGMIAANLFGHLPFAELVEENQAFRNQAGARFVPRPAWGLGSTASGRGMVMADLDTDGDLDIVVNNLRGSATLFENQLCGGAAIEVDLRWPDSANPFAVGAQLRLQTGQGWLSRDIRASGGYLSGDPLRVHFGLPENTTVTGLEITWPDRAMSWIEAPAQGSLLTLQRTR